MPAQEMGKWLRALKLCVSYLTQDCEQLVAATLVSPPAVMNPTLSVMTIIMCSITHAVVHIQCGFFADSGWYI